MHKTNTTGAPSFDSFIVKGWGLNWHNCARIAATLSLAVTLTAAAQTDAQTAPPQDTFQPAIVSLKNPPFTPTAMTLQQVIDAAKTKNPTLLAAARNLDAVRAQEKQAAVRANPIFGIQGTDLTLPMDGSDGNPPSFAVQASRLFERGDKRHWRIDQARATTEQTAAQFQDQQRQLIYTLKQAFVTMLMAKASLALAQDNLKEFRHELEVNKARFDAGDIGKLDFERLDLQLSQFESDEASARVSLTQASFQLQTLIGTASPSDDPNAFDIQGDIVPPNISASNNLPSLIQTALVTRPDYLASQAAIRAADANVKLQNANGTADPTLEAEFEKSGYYNTVGASINIPIRIFDRNQGNKETAKFQVQSTTFARDAAANQVRSDVAQAWVGYTTSKALSDRYSQHYLDESKDVLDIAQFAYEHGGIALIDYLDALRDARTSTSDALNAYQQTWNAIHQLSAAAATELVP